MALTRTLAQLRDSVERTAGISAFVGAGKRHTEDSINDLVNRGLGALQRITAIVDPEFRPIASTDITTDGAATEYSLPSNCRSVISVHYEDDGECTWMLPFEIWERPTLADSLTTTNASRAYAYKVIGSNIEFLPLPPEDHTITVWYATTANQLSSDGQTVDVFDRLDDYVIWWAAREVAMDREDWERHDRLTDKIARMEQDIQVLARSRDLSHPARVVDVREANRYGRVRYR